MPEGDLQDLDDCSEHFIWVSSLYGIACLAIQRRIFCLRYALGFGLTVDKKQTKVVVCTIAPSQVTRSAASSFAAQNVLHC